MNVEAEIAHITKTYEPGSPRLKALGALARRLKVEKTQPLTLYKRREDPTTPLLKEAPMSAWDEIVTRATDLVAKGLARTKEQAITRVCTSNPELYARMRCDGSAPKAPGVPAPVRTITKSDPELALEALAKNLQAESKGSLTFYQAYDRALGTPAGRELYATYREHQRQATRR